MNIQGRIKEPSTWAGLAAMLETLKLFLPAYVGAITGMQAIVGGVAVLMRESSPKNEPVQKEGGPVNG